MLSQSYQLFTLAYEESSLFKLEDNIKIKDI